MKKKLMRKQPARARFVGRLELARVLHSSPTAIDRLIASGLPLAGRRGRANLYDVSAARQLARALKAAPSVEPNVLVSDYVSHAADLADRRRALLEIWLADATWRPAWRRLVSSLARRTGTWPSRLAARLGALSADDRETLFKADGPRPEPAASGRPLAPDDVRRLLDGPEAARPWRRAADAGIAVLASRGAGVEVFGGGAWRPWTPALGLSVPPTWPAPVMRSLLAELATALQSPVAEALATALAAPAPSQERRAATTPRRAREQWRRARGDYRRVRVAIRRNHRRRADVERAVAATIRRVSATWWAARHELIGLAGDPRDVHQAADRIHVRTLHDLTTLGGFLPAEITRRSGARRSTP